MERRGDLVERRGDLRESFTVVRFTAVPFRVIFAQEVFEEHDRNLERVLN